MIYKDIYDYNYRINMINDTEKAIEEDDILTIEKILQYNKLLGLEKANNFDIRPFYNMALSHGRDDIAYLFFENCPNELKLNFVEHYIDDSYLVYTDILGISVIYNRVNFINKLLDYKYPYNFDVDGIKITNSYSQNFYHIKECFPEENSFSFSRDSKIYISSPLLLSIIVGHWESYKLLKSRGAFYDPDDESCMFHLSQCKNQKIIDDIKYSYL